jgi:hypothetical protein
LDIGHYESLLAEILGGISSKWRSWFLPGVFFKEVFESFFVERGLRAPELGGQRLDSLE